MEEESRGFRTATAKSTATLPELSPPRQNSPLALVIWPNLSFFERRSAASGVSYQFSGFRWWASLGRKGMGRAECRKFPNGGRRRRRSGIFL